MRLVLVFVSCTVQCPLLLQIPALATRKCPTEIWVAFYLWHSASIFFLCSFSALSISQPTGGMAGP
eukprot:746522-Hanusia_phi.AAC.8